VAPRQTSRRRLFDEYLVFCSNGPACYYQRRSRPWGQVRGMSSGEPSATRHVAACSKNFTCFISRFLRTLWA